MWVIDNQQYLGQLDGWNRAAQFADGLFETMVVKSGKILGLKHHVTRMTSGLARLNITLPDENLADLFKSYSHIFADLTATPDGVLKIIVSRGDSQRGYGYDQNIKPHVTAFYNRLPAYDESIYQQGVAVSLLHTQCAIQPQLAGLKHLNRLENVLAKNELDSESFEGLMQNHSGYVIEGTMSNVFFEKDSQLMTPNLDLSGVDGVMRQCILQFASRSKINIEIKDIPVADLESVTSGFITNSVMGIVPIKKLNGRMLEIGKNSLLMMTSWKEGKIYE